MSGDILDKEWPFPTRPTHTGTKWETNGDPITPLLKRLGLSRHEVKELAGIYVIRHSPVCRAFNPKGNGASYRCICEFFSKIMAMAWREFDGGEGA